MIKTILTKVPRVHALIVKTPVFRAKIKVVSMSGLYAPHDWWLFEDGWMSLTHSSCSPWRSYMPLFTGMLEHLFLLCPLQVAFHPGRPPWDAVSAQVFPYPLSHARSSGLAPLRVESWAEVPACLVSLVLYMASPSFCRRLSWFGSNPCFVAPAGKHRAQMKSVMQLVVSAAASYHVLASRYRWGSQERVCIEAHMLPLSPFYCPPRPVRSEVGSRGASRV